MKKIIILTLLLSFISVSGVHARCLYQEIKPACSILGETYTSTCAGWSDTSTWNIPIAYQGECQNKPILTEIEQTAVASILYKYLDKKDYITSETDEYYSLTREGQEYIQNQLFSAIQKLITQEIEKSSPNHKRIAIYNYLVSLVGYDYYISK